MSKYLLLILVLLCIVFVVASCVGWLDILLPLHFRSLFLIVLGLWLWTLNWFTLASLGLNLNILILHNEDNGKGNANIDDSFMENIYNGKHSSQRSSLLGISWVYSGLFVVLWILFQSTIATSTRFGFSVSTLLLSCYLSVIIVTILPANLFYRKERYGFLKAFYRISLGSFCSHVSFADVLLADIFTSFSRVFGDLFLATCSIFYEEESELFTAPTCSSSAFVYIFAVIPYMWRLRQCIADFYTSDYKNSLQIFNALKYASIVPVFLTGHLLNSSSPENETGVQLLFRYWLFFALLNSSYSFYWDIVHDWSIFSFKTMKFRNENLLFNFENITIGAQTINADIMQLVPLHARTSPPPQDPSTSTLLYNGSPSFYYFCVIFNFFARFFWAIRLYMLYSAARTDKEIYMDIFKGGKAKFISETHDSDSVSDLFRNEPCCLGVDEAGRGPVLGPMVYGIGFCPVSRHKELRDQGMDDSKKLTAETREKLFEMARSGSLRDWFGWSVHVLSPHDISRAMLQRDKYNLNELSHDTAILLVKSAIDRGVNVTEVYVDTVGSPEKYQLKLQKYFPGLKITVAKKADSLYPVVSAASICAKVARDQILETWKFSEECCKNLDLRCLGSGYPADPLTQKWLSENVDHVFGYPNLIRFSWSTCANILEKSAALVKWECEEEETEQESFRPVKRLKEETKLKTKKLISDRGSLFKAFNCSSVCDF